MAAGSEEQHAMAAGSRKKQGRRKDERRKKEESEKAEVKKTAKWGAYKARGP